MQRHTAQISPSTYNARGVSTELHGDAKRISEMFGNTAEELAMNRAGADVSVASNGFHAGSSTELNGDVRRIAEMFGNSAEDLAIHR